ncbi:hypothetical protein JTE90_004236 [Oedothorax gibbosus]|uniref:Uncharacterized protein n=1 Tax=Oedothorax gibbosus TaxID=931172 RepID=A0AAV6URM8_9ARAC|nr:hypothetical protein JTE90_004236 [Oedothorax gibbosus]
MAAWHARTEAPLTPMSWEMQRYASQTKSEQRRLYLHLSCLMLLRSIEALFLGSMLLKSHNQFPSNEENSLVEKITMSLFEEDISDDKITKTLGPETFSLPYFQQRI